MSLPKDKFQLEYLARLNVVYHERRERRYAVLIRWTAFVTVLLSSAAVASLTDFLLPPALRSAGLSFAVVFGLIVTVINAAALAFDWYGQLSAHARFKAKWVSLAVDAGLLDDGDQVRFKELARAVGRLVEDEPAPHETELAKASALTRKAFGLSPEPNQ